MEIGNDLLVFFCVHYVRAVDDVYDDDDDDGLKTWKYGSFIFTCNLTCIRYNGQYHDDGTVLFCIGMGVPL